MKTMRLNSFLKTATTDPNLFRLDTTNPSRYVSSVYFDKVKELMTLIKDPSSECQQFVGDLNTVLSEYQSGSLDLLKVQAACDKIKKGLVRTGLLDDEKTMKSFPNLVRAYGLAGTIFKEVSNTISLKKSQPQPQTQPQTTTAKARLNSLLKIATDSDLFKIDTRTSGRTTSVYFDRIKELTTLVVDPNSECQQYLGDLNAILSEYQSGSLDLLKVQTVSDNIRKKLKSTGLIYEDERNRRDFKKLFRAYFLADNLFKDSYRTISSRKSQPQTQPQTTTAKARLNSLFKIANTGKYVFTKSDSTPSIIKYIKEEYIDRLKEIVLKINENIDYCREFLPEINSILSEFDSGSLDYEKVRSVCEKIYKRIKREGNIKYQGDEQSFPEEFRVLSLSKTLSQTASRTIASKESVLQSETAYVSGTPTTTSTSSIPASSTTSSSEGGLAKVDRKTSETVPSKSRGQLEESSALLQKYDRSQFKSGSSPKERANNVSSALNEYLNVLFDFLPNFRSKLDDKLTIYKSEADKSKQVALVSRPVDINNFRLVDKMISDISVKFYVIKQIRQIGTLDKNPGVQSLFDICRKGDEYLQKSNPIIISTLTTAGPDFAEAYNKLGESFNIISKWSRGLNDSNMKIAESDVDGVNAIKEQAQKLKTIKLASSNEKSLTKLAKIEFLIKSFSNDQLFDQAKNVSQNVSKIVLKTKAKEEIKDKIIKAASFQIPDATIIKEASNAILKLAYDRRTEPSLALKLAKQANVLNNIYIKLK